MNLGKLERIDNLRSVWPHLLTHSIFYVESMMKLLRVETKSIIVKSTKRF